MLAPAAVPTAVVTFGFETTDLPSPSTPEIAAVSSSLLVHAPAAGRVPAMAFVVPPNVLGQAATALFSAAPAENSRNTYITELYRRTSPFTAPGAAAAPSDPCGPKTEVMTPGASEAVEPFLPQTAGLAAFLSSPDLSALELGLQQFLGDLGQMGPHFAAPRDESGLWVWVAAASAASAMAACEIAHWHLKRSIRASAAEDARRLFTSLQDLFGHCHE